jgi:hypothetical protein
MSEFEKKKENFYFWDEMWNDSIENKNEKITSKNSLEDPQSGVGNQSV